MAHMIHFRNLYISESKPVPIINNGGIPTCGVNINDVRLRIVLAAFVHMILNYILDGRLIRNNG